MWSDITATNVYPKHQRSKARFKHLEHVKFISTKITEDFVNNMIRRENRASLHLEMNCAMPVEPMYLFLKGINQYKASFEIVKFFNLVTILPNALE